MGVTRGEARKRCLPEEKQRKLRIEMNDDILAIFIRYLFAEEKRQFTIPPRQVEKRLAEIREKAGTAKEATEGVNDGQPQNHRISD